MQREVLGLDLGPETQRPRWPPGLQASINDGNPPVPSCLALRSAVSKLYRLDDFDLSPIGTGFFSDVYKVTDKNSGQVMVLKLNKHRSNRSNMLKEVQLMKKLNHPNILKLIAACVHEGQLHALTEFINGGSLEEIIQNKNEELPWHIRMSIALDTAKGLAYLHTKGMFHRDLTSKNILIKVGAHRSFISAIIGDLGLATKIPKQDVRLPQVGSPYWMSPECLKGKFYDKSSDVFSFGIIMCELIARIEADPDVLPRTANFGVDYIAFSSLCPHCPPEFLKLAFSCLKIEPSSRPNAANLVLQLQGLIAALRKEDDDEEQELDDNYQKLEEKIRLKRVGHRRTLSEEEVVRRSPSEKARFHFRPQLSVLSIGKEMSLRDPDYRPTINNPFDTLPRLREGRKIIGSSRDLFSSCFELPSPIGGSDWKMTKCWEDGEDVWRLREAKSLPHSRRQSVNENDLTITPTIRFEEHLFQGRVQLLKKLYSGGQWRTQDDSALEITAPSSGALRRRGSCESGFFSVGTGDFIFDSSALSSTRSLTSSLVTVSDLEEDLIAASAFLSYSRSTPKRVFNESLDDLSSIAEDELPHSGRHRHNGYDKDIREIVRYFEATCRTDTTKGKSDLELIFKKEQESQIHLPRSKKIDALIKRVVEKESRDRFRKSFVPPQRLQVCDGIVRSKLHIFDEAKGARYRQGSVQAKMKIFDGPSASSASAAALSGNAKRIAERRLLALAGNNENSMPEKKSDQQRT